MQTGTLREHQRSDLITKLAGVAFDPEAECPRYKTFLSEIMQDNEALILWLQRFLGMCLSGDIREQIFPIFFGGGQNGKSVLLDTVSFVMGDYACDAPPELVIAKRHNDHQTEIMDLQGRRLVIASECEADRRLRLQLVKRMTGDATLKGRRMRENHVEFARTHKTVMVTNNRPIISETTKAAWRRLRLIPFDYEVPDSKRDGNLLKTLRSEGAGILRWLVDGCTGWLADGLPDVPEIEAATSTYRTEQDVLAEFIEDRLIESGAGRISRPELWAAYTDWADKTNERHPLNKSQLYQRIREKGFDDAEQWRIGKKRVRGFLGLELALEGE